jgi:hypothetical protein
VALCNDQPGSWIAGYSACSKQDDYDVNLGIVKAVGKCKSKDRITDDSPNDAYKQVLKKVKAIERRNRARKVDVRENITALKLKTLEGNTGQTLNLTFVSE